VKYTRTGIAALAVLVIAATALVLTSIGSAKPASKQATPFKMAIVTDIGSLQDRSFNQLANTGRKAIGKKLGIPTRVYETHSESERIPNMLAASKAGYNMIFAVGFLNYTALNAVAPKFPNQKFAGVDEPYVLFSKKPKNAAGSRPRRKASTRSRPWARTTCPRSCTTSAATSRARRRRTRASRSSRTTRTTRRSTIRRSATRRR
jgi:hypothetical protein